MPGVTRNSLWSIILAGGEGTRTRPFIEQWLGYHKPKQYCTFVGTRSMLQHTLERADRLSKPEHRMTVIGRNHGQFAREASMDCSAGHIIEQPRNCGTAAGVFLPLTFVRKKDPEAMVVIFPSDHFVFPNARFLETVKRGIRACEVFQDRLVLFGIRPSRLELDYGWINVGDVLGWSGGSCIVQADSFLEKPGSFEGLQALAHGALWNTMILIARVDTLWNLGKGCFPVLMDRFEQLATSIGSSRERQVLRHVYQYMPQLNFSADILQRVPGHIGVMELEDVIWSDWGRPERIIQTLEQLGKEPAFPHEMLSYVQGKYPQSLSAMEVL